MAAEVAAKIAAARVETEVVVTVVVATKGIDDGDGGLGGRGLGDRVLTLQRYNCTTGSE